jgi:hypothetical protein
MHAYKFRIQSEENEDFLMDIEVKASQSFLDFHNAIKQFCNITSNELASFYVCDDKWRKKTEIMLIDMSETDEEDQDKKPVLTMEKAVLNKVIDNPHQRFLYVYDFMKMHTFYIELIQIKPTSASVDYPVLIKKEGDLNLNKPSGLLGFLEEDESLEIIPDDAESFFGEEADPDELDNLNTDTFFEDSEKF